MDIWPFYEVLYFCEIQDGFLHTKQFDLGLYEKML